MARLHIGKILVQEGAIDAAQLRTGLEWQKRWGGRLGRALVQLGMLHEADLVRALGNQFGIAVIDLEGYRVEPQVLERVPVAIIERRRVLPLALLSEARRGPILVATSDPLDVAAMDEVAFATGMQVRPVLAAHNQLEAAIERALGRGHPDPIELPAEPAGPMDLVHHQRGGAFWH